MKISFLSSLLIVLTFYSISSFSHCQVPCGIYDDPTIFKQMYVDCATISKASTQVQELSKNEHPNFNQIVRWINEKDRSANNIITTCSEYFLAQRINDTQKNYEQKLILLHKIILTATKSKQTTDTSVSDTLQTLIHSFEHMYNEK